MMNAPTRRPILSRSEFFEALASAVSQAADAGAREIWLCDPDFTDWPLGERGIVDDLERWAGGQRRMTVLAHSFDEVARRHPRWVDWRRRWAHVVQCRSNGELEATGYPTICLVPGVISVRLLDTVRFRGLASHEAGDQLECRETLDGVAQRSVETFAATTIGL